MNISSKYHISARKLDFININLSGDNKIFVDPLKLKKGDTEFQKVCYQKVDNFMRNLLNLVKEKDFKQATEIIENLYERNETKLGYSLETKFGKSFGKSGGKVLVKTLAKSDMLLTGKVEDIFDCIIMLPNIGEDKVSDLITTIIFLDLVSYTQEQCKKWNIPMKEQKLEKLCWNSEREEWEKIKANLPIHKQKPIVFIPRDIASNKIEFSYEKLYREVIIPLYKQRELEDLQSNLVIKYKNGKKQVMGNKLRKLYPCTKYVILDFVQKYDRYYREFKGKIIE